MSWLHICKEGGAVRILAQHLAGHTLQS